MPYKHLIRGRAPAELSANSTEAKNISFVVFILLTKTMLLSDTESMEKIRCLKRFSFVVKILRYHRLIQWKEKHCIRGNHTTYDDKSTMEYRIYRKPLTL